MRKYILALAVLLTAVYGFAVPAFRGWMEKTQPDGSIVKVQLQGDEMFHYYINESGARVQEDANGFWKVVGEAPSLEDIQKHRRENPIYRSRQAAMSTNGGPRRVGSTNLAPRGLFILVNFSDSKYQSSNTQEAMNEMMNGDNYTYNGAMGSARKYFIDQSNGAYTPIFDVVGPVTLSKQVSYYGKNKNNVDGNDMYAGNMIIEACSLADSQFDVDFTQYDNDGDGNVDFVYVIYAGKGEADGGAASTIWPHNWSISAARWYGNCTYSASQCRFDGKYIDNYACSGELNGYSGKRNGIGTLCHEFGHVLGLPDYYDTDYGTNYKNGYTPGDWDIMDSGSYNGDQNCPPNYSPWEKYFFGWATPTCLNESKKGTYTLTTDYSDFYQVNNNGTLANWSNTSVQYYIENRQKTGWDTYLPGHGMLVWKVQYDKSAWDGDVPNNTANSPRYVVVSASGNMKMQGAADPFPGTRNVTSYTPFAKYPILNIKENNKQIKFTFIEESLPVDTFTFVSTNNAGWVDASAAHGWFQIITKGESEFGASISTLNSPRTMGEFLMADLDMDYTFIEIPNGTEFRTIDPADAKAVLSTDSEGIITGKLTLVEKGTGDIYIAIIKHDPSLPVPMSYDTNEDVDVAFNLEDISENTASGASPTMISFKAIMSDESYMLSLVFYANSTDDDIVIPAGTYSLSDSKAAGTVLISPGVIENSVYPSFLATINGQYLHDLWFPIDGTVTVEKGTINNQQVLYLTLDATNSYGAIVKATVGKKPTPTTILKTTDNKSTTKMLKNGHLLIHREGKTYNVLGSKME